MSSTVLGAREAVINDAFFQVAHSLIKETNIGKKNMKSAILNIFRKCITRTEAGGLV